MPQTYEPIATVNPSGTTLVTFSSIPATYTDLRIVANVIGASAGNDVFMYFNGDTTGTYDQEFMTQNGGSPYPGNYQNTQYYWSAPFSYTSTTRPIVLIADIYDYAGSKFKSILTTTGEGEWPQFAMAIWKSTAAINTIVVRCGVNFAADSNVTLYGIKAA